jgi:Zn-dependent membrane protease YugP
MFFFDPTYLLFMAPAFILMMLTSWYVRSAYNKWSQVPASSRLTGAEVAQRLIRNSAYVTTGNGRGLLDVRVQGVGGNLSDHYDPRSKTLRLSQGVANSASVAAVAVAAHELGHALQDAEDYLPLRFRAALVPAVNIGSWLGWILILIGLFLNMLNLAWLGVIIFSGGALFALATLPVELDASARAKRLLAENGIIQGEREQRGVNRVLNAAALTYVAALVTAVLQLLYFVSLIAGRRD